MKLFQNIICLICISFYLFVSWLMVKSTVVSCFLLLLLMLWMLMSLLIFCILMAFLVGQPKSRQISSTVELWSWDRWFFFGFDIVIGYFISLKCFQILIANICSYSSPCSTKKWIISNLQCSEALILFIFGSLDYSLFSTELLHFKCGKIHQKSWIN